MTGPRATPLPTDRLLNAAAVLTLLWTLSIPLSIAISESALWLAAATWGLVWLIRELQPGTSRAMPNGPGPAGDAVGLVGAPVIAFFAVSLLSTTLSREPVEGLLALREVFLFAAPVVAWLAFRDGNRRDWSRQLLGVGVLAAICVAAWQMLAAPPDPAGVPFRPTGPLGHYMTFSGVLLVSVPVLLTIRGGFKTIAGHVVAILAIGMIGLTLTRSAWIGCAVSLAVYFGTGRAPGSSPTPAKSEPRLRPALYAMALLIGLVIVGLLAASLAGPEALYDRAASVFSLEDPSNLDRLAMAAVGLRMIKAYPLLGIGPGLMETVYPAWVVDWAVRDTNPHLHNNVLQIAAERGLVGLAAWLWMMTAFVVVAWRVLRAVGPAGEGGPEARAALGALCGFMTMGLFEYNFSDSEVLMALLYVISLPLAASAGLASSDDGAPR